MKIETASHSNPSVKVEPLCPVFGVCGGCAYQDIPYDEELSIKEDSLRECLQEKFDLSGGVFDQIVPSPEPYHYRNRLDMTVLRIKSGEVFLGFNSGPKHRVISTDSCAIARPEISDFIPELKQQAEAKLPADYRVANLVVKTGGDGRVLWGGIGKRSLRLQEEDYLSVTIAGRKIFYSLDTFFQANLGILPLLIERIRNLMPWDKTVTFLDLYSGVGLFGISLAEEVKRVILIEEHTASIELARFNVRYQGFENVEIRSGKVENELPHCFTGASGKKNSASKEKWIAMVDPPRKGLSPEALEALVEARRLRGLLYLSCSPESLTRDLGAFVKKGWQIEKIIPFDFFPKTKHLETLAVLKP